MDEERNRKTIEAFVEALRAKDATALDGLFTDDVIIEWPQSGERIVGEANRREIYHRYPGLPSVEVRRMVGHDDLWVLEADLEYENGDGYQTIFYYELRDGRIARETGYWAKPFPAPEWRAPWVERMDAAMT